MKKKLFLLLFIVIVISLVITYLKFSDQIIPFVADLMNLRPQQYFGATVDMSQVLPSSTHYLKNNKGQDLIDLASNLGMNTLRITNITSISGIPVSSYSHAQWQEVLGKMQSKGMYAVVLVEANAQDTNFDRVHLNDYYLNFVHNYVIAPGVCKFPNVLAIDIANEPLLNTANLKILKRAADDIRVACPNTKITIGSWRTDSGQIDPSGQPIYYWHDPKEVKQLEDIVDIDSVHIYGFDKPLHGPYPDPFKLTTAYLDEVRKYTKKPIFIEEFGAGNGEALTDQNTLGSPELQKAVYEGVLKAVYDFRNRGVMGAAAYLLYPRMTGIDSWSITIDNANKLLPAAYTFKKYFLNNFL